VNELCSERILDGRAQQRLENILSSRYGILVYRSLRGQSRFSVQYARNDDEEEVELKGAELEG
jgi:hypothetical protein